VAGEPPQHAPRGARWRVTGALLAWPVASILVVAWPLAGAAEHLVLAGLLLAAALPWALLALAPTRRWAAWPAALLAASGVLLVVAAPGSAALDALGWGWPVAVAVLAGWIVVRERRGTPPRHAGRLLVQSMAMVLGVMAVGGVYGTVGTSLDAAAYPPPGRLIDIGDHRLHLHCTGSGSPTVILEAVSGGVSPLWGWVQPAVAQETRVCAYDRAGLGWSDPADGPQDSLDVAADLQLLLERAGERGPYVLVGHSLGGVYARIVADRMPEQVVGMVLIDSSHPDQYSRVPEMTAEFESYRDIQSVFPVMARLGLWRLYFDAGGQFDLGGLPPDAREQAAAFWSAAALHHSQRDENAAPRPQVETGDLGDLPLAVLTAGDSPPSWVALQDDLASLSTNVVHRTLDGATHTSLVTDERYAAVVAETILDIVGTARTAG
jgi:pimeloyl-ACP methyl ester carboxylesterase